MITKRNASDTAIRIWTRILKENSFMAKGIAKIKTNGY